MHYQKIQRKVWYLPERFRMQEKNSCRPSTLEQFQEMHLAITDFISLTKPESQVALHASLAETNDSDDFFCVTNRTLSVGFLSWTILMYVQTRHSLVRCFALNMWTTWMRSILKFQLIFMGSWNIVVFSMTIQVTYTIANCRFLI